MQVGLEARHPDAVPDLWLAEGRLRGDLPRGAPDRRHLGGDAQQDRPQRRPRIGADPEDRLVSHRSREEPGEPPGAGAAGQPPRRSFARLRGPAKTSWRGLLKIFGVRLAPHLAITASMRPCAPQCRRLQELQRRVCAAAARWRPHGAVTRHHLVRLDQRRVKSVVRHDPICQRS